MAKLWQGARKEKEMKMKEMNGAGEAAGMDAVVVVLIAKFVLDR